METGLAKVAVSNRVRDPKSLAIGMLMLCVMFREVVFMVSNYHMAKLAWL